MAGDLYSRESQKPTTWYPKYQTAGYRSQTSRIEREHLAGELLVHCHPNNLQNNLYRRCQNTLTPRRCRNHPSKGKAKIAKGGPVRYAEIIELGLAAPRVGAAEVVPQQAQEERQRFRSRRKR